jgi:hypothetical protein
MTDEMMSLRALLEKAPDADVLRGMIGFAAERLMEMEIGALAGAPYDWRSATAIASERGRRGPERSSCVSRSFARAAIFPAFSSRGGLPRRR